MNLKRIALFLLLSTLVWAQTASSPVPDEKSPAPQAQTQQGDQAKTPPVCPCCVKTAQNDATPMQCPMMAKNAKPGQRCCAMNAKGKMQCGKDGTSCCANMKANDSCCNSGKMACAHAPKNAKHGQGCCGMSCPMMQPGN
jgi:hypothetical protein